MKQTPLENLLNEVRLLYQSMVQIGDELHAPLHLSMGMRAVLEYLAREGPATVPQMARARRVTRQRIQSLVNALLAKALVEKQVNPRTQRSHLIAITSAGLRVIEGMRRKEGDVFDTNIDDNRLMDTADVLKRVRLSLEENR